jgi:hypothetical protein
MWTRIYLTLLLVRLYFALTPSYIHPDENFQGPEVIAGTCLHCCVGTVLEDGDLHGRHLHKHPR